MTNLNFKLQSCIFKENDIRGKYPLEVNEGVAFILGKAFALLLQKIYKKPIKIIIGFDNRKSSPSLAKFFISGLIKNLKEDISILNIGLTTTPLFYFSLIKLKAEAGLMITASHNPFNENGFLFYLKEGVSLFAFSKRKKEFEKFVYKEFKNYQIKEINLDFKGLKNYKEINFKKEYLNFLKKFLDIKKPLKFVLDDGGGTTGFLLKDFIKLVNNKFLKLYLVKGKKYRFSNPLIEKKLSFLKKIIKKYGADGGVAFDSDGDRAVFLDENGKLIEPDQIFGFLTSYFLKTRKKAKVVGTEFLNQKILKKIKKIKGKIIFSQTGYGNFYLKMRKNKAVFGGEHSGHYYFKDFNYHDDGILTLIFILNLLSKENKSLSQLKKEWPVNPSIFLNFQTNPLKARIILSFLKQITKNYQKPTFEDLKIKYKNWLMIWRISGTSQFLRVYLENLKN